MSGAARARSLGRAVLRWAARLVLLALALAVAGSLVIVIALPRATHGSAMTVLTGSMTPKIPVGSIVLVRPVDTNTLRVGDVATYQAKPGKAEYITHRIVDIDRSTTPVSFTFKGDANRGPDIKPIPATAIRGAVWFHVPYLGAIRDALHGKGGLSLVGMLVLAGYALSQLSGAAKDRKQRKVATIDLSATRQDRRLEIDRTLMRVTFDRARVVAESGMTPRGAAEHWSALLIDENDETFTLLLAPAPDGAVPVIELLTLLDPLELEVCEPPNAVVGAPASPDVLAAIRSGSARPEPMEHDHAIG
jgi:signal peptidase I